MSGAVYPVWKNKFKIGIKGIESKDEDMVPVKGMSTFSPSIDGNPEEWKEMENEGWTSRMVVGKSLGVSLSGKRCLGDPGNDYIEACAWGIGDSCNSKFEWEFPSGAKLSFDCVVVVSNVGGGDADSVAPLEFEVQSDGKPVFTPAPAKAVSK